MKRARANVNDWLTDEGLILLEAWARDGLTNEQISKKVGCNPDTLYKWMKRYSEISEALKKGKEVVDIQVENALLKRAVGFHFTEQIATPSGEVVDVVRYEKPDTTAAIYWLRNRKRGTWNNQDGVDIDKKQAETEFTKERTKLIKGVEKDTSLMDVLVDAVTKDG